ncbi:MAG: DNA polymerase/3'-5' exonuclease PolX [Candidatus Micrarchaeota archaeon]|nr:DNA polymerase/3'-5' exonuclease PolX [Candidatus Micrarchaeota archaeon]MDE1847705.1 DNA polymerase/3'-5' exonuclease PolX [Candidatus Micrarchaeota archaeon]MDE1864134.1 DNA polymerase/3'-5' exonuclease PolX [Candidatus Micrarchaeota archaeon]
MSNKRLAEILEEIASMLDLEGENLFFEVRAYRKAAQTLETMQQEVEEIFKKEGEEGLRKLPGVGKTIASHIIEFVEKGKIKKYDELKKKYPIDFAALTKIQGMGARKAFKLYKALGVRNMDDLRKAIAKHRVRDIDGFGEKSEQDITKGIEFLEKSGGRQLLGVALPVAEALVKQLKASKTVENAVVAGSARRMKETVGDLDILIVSEDPSKVEEAIAKMGEVDSIIAKGPTKISVVLKMGINCDFRIIEKDSFGAGLQYFTGSKDHGVQVRQIAVRKGYSLNEYQLSDKNGKKIVSRTEEEIYGKLGLDYIVPEMREARGEVDLAIHHKLPKLIAPTDMKGDLHTHTKFTDGINTIEEMAEKAASLGYEYIGLTDHSKSEYQTGGMDDKKFVNYFAQIDKANDKLDGKIKVLKSGEVDILKDGTLDLSSKTLDKMDYALCSIHSSFNLPKEDQTKRVMRAFESGYVRIFGHPTARLINQREPVQLDLDKVFESAKENNVVMEINSRPERLDLNDENIIRARGYGLKFAIDTDAHQTAHMEMMRYGIGTAQRGWITKGDVINTLAIDKFLKFLNR